MKNKNVTWRFSCCLARFAVVAHAVGDCLPYARTRAALTGYTVAEGPLSRHYRAPRTLRAIICSYHPTPARIAHAARCAMARRARDEHFLRLPRTPRILRRARNVSCRYRCLPRGAARCAATHRARTTLLRVFAAVYVLPNNRASHWRIILRARAAWRYL